MSHTSQIPTGYRATLRTSVFVRAIALALITALLACALAGCGSGIAGVAARNASGVSGAGAQSAEAHVASSFDFGMVPEYAGEPCAEINGNVPFFTAADRALEPFGGEGAGTAEGADESESAGVSDQLEIYSELDGLGRCGAAFALVGPETMPTMKRGSIGAVRPSGWRISKYDWIDGGYLFNRCHLIAYALSGENDNPLNLITGTRSMNVAGMLPFEERVAGYVDRTGNHVLYRVTPVFEGDNLVASGVLMEAESVEDAGAGIRFCTWCYNVEPGVAIDYATGDNHADGTMPADAEGGGEANGADASAASDGPAQGGAASGPGASAALGGAAAASVMESAESAPSDAQPNEATVTPQVAGEAQSASPSSDSSSAHAFAYVANTNTHRFHYPDCRSVSDIREKNRLDIEGTRDDLIALGYVPCGICKP